MSATFSISNDTECWRRDTAAEKLPVMADTKRFFAAIENQWDNQVFLIVEMTN
jgi:hypothetical protein